MQQEQAQKKTTKKDMVKKQILQLLDGEDENPQNSEAGNQNIEPEEQVYESELKTEIEQEENQENEYLETMAFLSEQIAEENVVLDQLSRNHVDVYNKIEKLYTWKKQGKKNKIEPQFQDEENVIEEKSEFKVNMIEDPKKNVVEEKKQEEPVLITEDPNKPEILSKEDKLKMLIEEYMKK